MQRKTLMKITLIILAAIMTTAAPVFAKDVDGVKYLIGKESGESSYKEKLKDFILIGSEKSAEYTNDNYKNPKLFTDKSDKNKGANYIKCEKGIVTK